MTKEMPARQEKSLLELPAASAAGVGRGRKDFEEFEAQGAAKVGCFEILNRRRIYTTNSLEIYKFVFDSTMIFSLFYIG